MKRNIDEIVQEMTLEEKAGLCSGLDFWHLRGVERLGVPSIMVTDGPHGLRKQREGSDHVGLFNSVPATCFPSAAGVASSWDRELITRMGQALGAECQAENVAVLLGPGANIKRSPLCGRNFEYFSEDPYLSSEMAAAHIAGVQSQGVGASLKHFAVNNQEHRRMTTNAVVDERTLREIYLASFEGAVKKSQPWTVMCSYNQVNGEFASENRYLLTDILKEEWGFEGFVVSDWGAVNQRVAGLNAGLELEMPSSNGAGERLIIKAVQDGTLSMEKLDGAVRRLLRVIFKAVDGKREGAVYNAEEHHRMAREIARESMVLLKNEDHLLPLAKSASVAVIGELATKPRYQGSGSSRINPTKLEDIREEIRKAAGGEGVVAYAQGYQLDSDVSEEELIQEARQLAAQADVAVLFAGLPDRYESEGFDRSHIRLPDNQIALIESIAEVQPNLVVVLSNGAPVEMPWIGSVKSLLEAYLGGQALGGAIADLLYGDANPCGKLAESFSVCLEHNPSYPFFPGEGDRVEYREGLFVGYRYYDAKRIEPLFPFGFGLSYTTFQYDNLVLSQAMINDNEEVVATVDITNTGSRSGKEIVQLYVRDVESTVIRPQKELKGFAKVELAPGETKSVSFTLDKRSFAYYNADRKDWHVETGDFEVLIGSSSRDIVLRDIVQVVSTSTVKPRYHRNSTIGDLMSNPEAAALVSEWMRTSPFGAMAAQQEGEGAGMMQAMMRDMPLRALIAFSGGALDDSKLEELLHELNG